MTVLGIVLRLSEAMRYMEKAVVGAFTKYYTQHCQPSLACLPIGGGGDIGEGDGGGGGAGLTEGGGLDTGGPVPRCTNGLTVVARKGDCTLGTGN